MTAPRITRANRSRFLIGLGILFLTMGFVAIFTNSQQQLDKLRHMELRCDQQHEVLSSQISNAENSLKIERSNHQQTKHELEKKSKEEKENRQKFLMESNLKYTSLQQHYKLLKSQHDDLADSCSKKDKQQLEEINDLQGKFKSILSQNTQIVREKDKEIEHFKAKIKELENEKQNMIDDKLLNKLKNTNVKLKKELELLKSNCPEMKHNDQNQDQINNNRIHSVTQNSKQSERNADAQMAAFIPNILVDDNFKQPTNILEPPMNMGKNFTVSSVNPLAISQADVKLPNAPLPPQQLSSQGKFSSSTTEKSVKKSKETVLKTIMHRELPKGVVPLLHEDLNNYAINKQPETNNNENNRYLNVVNDIVEKKSSDQFDINNLNELENGAREVNDNNDFMVDEHSHKDHLRDVLDDNKLMGNNINNNAAEEDTNIYDKNFSLIKPNDGLNLNQKSDTKPNNNNSNNDRLLNEIDADQGKVVYPEEQLEEEDDDEYSNPSARKQDPAVRN